MVRASELAKPRKSAAARQAVPLGALEPSRLLQLIEAAETIFLAKGYHSATMSDVAKAAGISKKTVYQLIESKADLFAALLAHHQAQFSFPEDKPEWTPQQALVNSLVCLAKFVLSSSQVAIVRLIMAEYTHSPDLGRLLHQRRITKAKTQLESRLNSIARKHGFELKNAREMSAMLFGMAIGEFYMAVLVGYRAAPSKAALEQRVGQAVEIFLAGCERQPTFTGCAAAAADEHATRR